MANEVTDIVLLIQGEICTNNLTILSLPHPKGGITLYAINKEKLYELHHANPRRHAAWFLENNVSSENGFYLANEIDPRFLILPYFEKSEKRYSPLDQIVIQAENEGDRIPLEYIKHLTDIFDMNDKFGDDMLLYRYNEEKILQWLEKKVERAAMALSVIRLKKQNGTNSNFTTGFNPTAQNKLTVPTAVDDDIEDVEKNIHPDEYISGFQIVSDYLTDSMASKLSSHLGNLVKDIQVSAGVSGTMKRKHDWEIALEVEKETAAMYSTINSMKTPHAAENAKKNNIDTSIKKSKGNQQVKVVKPPPIGVKSITSFFSKK